MIKDYDHVKVLANNGCNLILNAIDYDTTELNLIAKYCQEAGSTLILKNASELSFEYLKQLSYYKNIVLDLS